MTVTAPRPIDPLARADGGRYVDEVVTVERTTRPVGCVWTPHFATWRDRTGIHVVHELPAARIDNDLSGLIANELFATGWLSGSDVFERVLTGVVLSSAADPDAAWELFYRNTLRRLESLPAAPGAAGSQAATGSLAEYGPVYDHVETLVEPGEVLELGSCFGFLSLRLAGRALVTASDVTPNTVRLLARVAPRLGVPVTTLVSDAARVPRPDRSYDTVLAIHLLEHLQPEHGEAVLAEMLRLARRRVVVAVPFETEPTAAFGHVRVFSLADLRELGRRALATGSGWSFHAYEHHGGWLVLDRDQM